MRAVNLIPADQRRGAGGLAGRSGGVAYVLTGALAVLVLLGIVYALAVHDVAKKKTDLAEVTQQVSVVKAEAQSLQPYVQFAGVSAAEVTQVNSLAQSRFDWPNAMRQLALSLPTDVTLDSFSANAGAGPVDAAGVAGTSFNLSGCASSQEEIATVLTRLASVPGVDDVTLTNTVENQKKGKHGAPSTASGGCAYTVFTLTVDYSGSYTVPDTKGAAKGSSGQTVSTSTPTISTAASQQSTGVTP